MNVQTAYQTTCATELGRSQCPCCGSIILMAEQAAFSGDGSIRHTWSCDDCGHEFVTSIRIRGQRHRREIAS
jgi:RNase P subunit RPR2